MSVLELVVVLGIAAGLLVMVAASLPRPSAEATDGAEIAAFLSEARTRVILLGETGALSVAERSMTFGDKRIDWGTDLAVTTNTGGMAAGYRLLLYPDGSYSGPPLYVRSAGEMMLVPGVFRSRVLDD